MSSGGIVRDASYHLRHARYQLVVLVAVVACSLGLGSVTTSASVLGLKQWSMGFLAQLGAPAASPIAPRVEFLERWANVEGTFDQGNRNNPLDTKMLARGATLYNSAGVKKYPTLTVGFKATLSTMRQSFDHPILAALSNRRATMATLGLALAESNWTGFGPRSWNEQVYASMVSGLPASSFHLPQPGVSIRGTVVNPLQQRAGGVCVSALKGNVALGSVLTAADGTYRIAGLPRAGYRLEISDCRHLLNNAPPAFYDAKAAAAQFTSRVRKDATLLSSACSIDRPCLSQNISVGHVMTFGILKPSLTWPKPAAISYGTPLSAAQLNARATVRGTLRYSVSRGMRLGPGRHKLSVIFKARDSAHFLTVRATEELVVNRVAPKLRWQSPAPLVAGAPLSANELDAVASVPGTFTYSPPVGTVLTPGTHPLAVRFQPANLRQYRAVTSEITIEVLQAPPSSSP